MKVGVAIRDVAEAEERLAQALLEVGERHRDEHDVHHMTRTLARWAQGHVAALEPFAERYGAEAGDGGPGRRTDGAASEDGLELLHDVRDLHLLAAEASIDWTILAQAAQAASDEELLECVSLCHPETLRTVRWTVTKLKEAAPQALTV